MNLRWQQKGREKITGEWKYQNNEMFHVLGFESPAQVLCTALSNFISLHTTA